MRLCRLRLGYLVLSVVVLLCLGTIYAWSIFRAPLQLEFGWSAEQMSVTFSISMTTFCLGGLVSGFLSSKKSARVTLVCCAAFLAIGFAGAARTASLLGIYVSYGGFCGFGVGLGYNATLGLIVRWFPDKQGLISGLSMMGFGFGGMILGTLGAKMIAWLGWRITFLLLGGGFSLLMLIGGAVLHPANVKVSERLCAVPQKRGEVPASRVLEELSWREMLRRRTFWSLLLWAIFMTAAGLAMINEAATYAAGFVDGDPVRAATLGGVVSIANGVGRIVFGQLFDRKGSRATMFSLSGLYLLSSGLLVLSAQTGTVWVLVVAFWAVGLAYGGVPPTNSANALYYFGRDHYGVNFSLLNLNMIAASYLGPMCSKTYGEIFGAIAIFAVIGALLTTLIQLRQAKAIRSEDQ